MKGKFYFEGITLKGDSDPDQPTPEPRPVVDSAPSLGMSDPSVAPFDRMSAPVSHLLPAPDLSGDPLPPLAVRRAREFLGMDQAEFSDALGVSCRAVKAWEHRKRDTTHSRNCTGPARILIQRLVADESNKADP